MGVLLDPGEVVGAGSEAVGQLVVVDALGPPAQDPSLERSEPVLRIGVPRAGVVVVGGGIVGVSAALMLQRAGRNVVLIEAALEFGAAAAINLGVASGKASMMGSSSLISPPPGSARPEDSRGGGVLPAGRGPARVLTAD